ncbi:MAG: AAA family ATPase [Armatimonadota bacterium]|nr:AAA family ATPase [Armatimonadota bacterium]
MSPRSQHTTDNLNPARGGDQLLRQVLDRLEAVRGPDSSGWYSARCPRPEFHRHQDRDPSLRLNERAYRCLQPACPLHAGGPLRLLALELGLDLEFRPGQRVTVRGEFDEAGARAFIEEAGLPWAAAEQLGVQFDRARSAIAFTWPGLEVRKLRLHQSAEPRFVWYPAGADSRPSLWPRVDGKTLTGARVVLAEGERDALALRALGLEAFSVTGGAGSPPRFEDLARLLALGVRDFLIAYDADAAGLEGAERCREAIYRAARHLGLKVGVRLLSIPGEVIGSGGKDWTDAVRLLGKEHVARHLHGAESPPRSAARLLTAADLLSQPDDESTTWLVDGLLPAGGLSVLVAKPKTGKSTLARALAVAVAQGREFLGRKVRQGPVLLLALEERPADVRRHLRQLGLRADDPLLVAFELGPGQLEQLRAWAAQHKPVLVEVDPLVRAVRVGDMAAYSEVARALGGFVDLAHASGAHLLLVHHAPKISDGRLPVDAPLGTTAISGAADVVLHLKRTPEGRRFLSSVQRVGEDLPEAEVVLGGDGWPSLGRTREEVDEARVLGSIMEFVGANPGATTRQVLKGVPGAQNVKVRGLHRLVQQGRLTCSGTGKRGDPVRYRPPESLLVTGYIPSNESNETPSGPEPAPDLDESVTRSFSQTGPQPRGASNESRSPGACPDSDPDPGDRATPEVDLLEGADLLATLTQEAYPEEEPGPPPDLGLLPPGPGADLGPVGEDRGTVPPTATPLVGGEVPRAPDRLRTCIDCGAPLPPDNLVRCEPCVARAWQEVWGEPPPPKRQRGPALPDATRPAASTGAEVLPL